MLMPPKLRDMASEVAEEIYNHKLPATAEEFLDLLEPISESIFDLLPCFQDCSSLDEVFSVFSTQFEYGISDSEIAHKIDQFGSVNSYYNTDTETSTIKPDWFIVGMQNEAYKHYSYFDSFNNAVASVIQISLANQMIQVLEFKNTVHDWRSITERQLAISLAVVKWYELGGDMNRCFEFLLKTFRMEGLEDFTTTGEFMLNYLNNKRTDFLADYYERFHGSPDFRDFNKPAKWQWYTDHLPDHF